MEDKFKSNLEIKSRLADIYQTHNDPEFWTEIGKITPQIQTYLKLIEYEKKIDALIKKKLYDFQESLIQPQIKTKKILRISVASNFIEPNLWSLKISGQILKKDHDSYIKKFSSFFNQISIHIDDQEVSSWKKNKTSPEVDCIEFRGQNEQEIKVTLTPFQIPQILQIDDSLFKIIGLQYATRVEVLQAFWEYVKLQDKECKNILNLNEPLATLFDAQSITIDQITGKIQNFLKQIQPIIITHCISQLINCSVDNTQEQFFDMVIHQDLVQNTDFGQFFLEEKIDTPQFQKLLQSQHAEQLKQNPYFIQASKIIKIEKRKKDYIGNLKNHLYKIQAYKQYNQNPQQFIENILNEQNMLLKIMKDKHELKDLYDKPMHAYNILYNQVKSIFQDLLEQEVNQYLNQNNQN